MPEAKKLKKTGGRRLGGNLAGPAEGDPWCDVYATRVLSPDQTPFMLNAAKAVMESPLRAVNETFASCARAKTQGRRVRPDAGAARLRL